NGERAALRDMSLIKEQRSYSQINSVDGRRIIALLGDIDETIRTTDEVMSTIDADIMPDIMQKYPDLSYSYEGKTRERADDLSSLKTNTFLAIFVIFAILAVQLRGYIAPFVIVANIPLGVVGAIYSHWILGYDLSFMSLFGIIALCGVVVNDSVVLIDFYNQMRAQGMNSFDALIAATRRRFRAILLTTLTNGFSTLPILLETSTQAQFLIPMAVSLSCGIFFSTALLFVFTPSLMHILQDIRYIFRKVRFTLIGRR
ncbi:MAG: efflux RND transporter permease subunit, partial [Pseudomonadota bacterium]